MIVSLNWRGLEIKKKCFHRWEATFSPVNTDYFILKKKKIPKNINGQSGDVCNKVECYRKVGLILVCGKSIFDKIKKLIGHFRTIVLFDSDWIISLRVVTQANLKS